MESVTVDIDVSKDRSDVAVFRRGEAFIGEGNSGGMEVEPLLAIGRELHHPSLRERFAGACAGKSNACGGHGLPPANAEGQKALRPAQTRP